MNIYNNKLALGTVQFGKKYGVSNQNDSKVSPNEVEKILSFAKEIKIDTLDTAADYGDSETVLGKSGVNNFNIITKLPYLLDTHNLDKDILNFTNRSLRNLKMELLYGLLVHKSTDLLSKNGEVLYANLIRLKEEGVVQKIGVSVYQPEEIDLLIERFDLDLIQAPFNVIDGRMLNSGIMQKLSNSKVELHVRSIFLQGLLLMKDIDRPTKFDKWSSTWKIWHEWLNDSKISAVGACLNYALSYKEISKVIVGVESLVQLKEIHQSISSSDVLVPEDLMVNDPMLLNPSNWV